MVGLNGLATLLLITQILTYLASPLAQERSTLIGHLLRTLWQQPGQGTRRGANQRLWLGHIIPCRIELGLGKLMAQPGEGLLRRSPLPLLQGKIGGQGGHQTGIRRCHHQKIARDGTIGIVEIPGLTGDGPRYHHAHRLGRHQEPGTPLLIAPGLGLPRVNLAVTVAIEPDAGPMQVTVNDPELNLPGLGLGRLLPLATTRDEPPDKRHGQPCRSVLGKFHCYYSRCSYLCRTSLPTSYPARRRQAVILRAIPLLTKWLIKVR